MNRVGARSLAGLRPAWYRFATTFRRRRGGYLAVVLLIGLLGGLAMASMAAARRTASSPSVFFASTKPSDLAGISGVLNPILGSTSGYDPRAVRAIARLPHVTSVESVSGADILPLARDGTPLHAPDFYAPSPGNGYGSVDGLFLDQDKVVVLAGRMADPRRPDELMLTPQAATALGVRVGGVLPIGVYTNAQTQQPGFGTAAVAPSRVVDERLVGTFEYPPTIVHDDVDAGNGPNNLFTPAFTRGLLACCVNYTQTGVRVAGGAAHAAGVASAIGHVLPGFPPFASLAPMFAKAQRAVKPLSIALGVFGGIVAVAALLVAGQAIGRQARFEADDRAVLRSLGAGPAATTADGLLGELGAIVLGAVLAVVMAVALSPLSPLGPFRSVYPDPGVSVDWTILGAGFAVLVAGLGAFTTLLAALRAPHRAGGRALDLERPSRLVAVAAATDLPAPAVTGVRFAVQSGRGRRAVPVRSAIVGAALAVVVIVATVTFGASLDSLVSNPPLYGWNWDNMLVSGADIPGPQVTRLLAADRYVRQWSGIYSATLALDGHSVPLLGERPGAAVAPPTLSGHGLERADQIVLGAATLAGLHKHVGDSVTLTSGQGAPARLRIVGTAAMPTIGSADPQHTEMGTGALLDYHLIPAADRNPFDNPVPGPNAIVVRLRAGVPRALAERSLHRIARATSTTANFGVTVTGTLRPAEIANYRSLGLTPLFLGLGLAGGAVAALALTLVSSVRRRQGDLAVLKTLGFTGGQLASTIAWQSTVAVGMGTIAGVPLGIGIGRWLWGLFARDIHAVPAPAVPVAVVVGIAAGALVLANVVAFVPGRLAARTAVASLLHSE